MTKWQTIHAHHPIVCEGKGKSGKWGCAAWDKFNERCYYAIFNDGECGRSVEAAIEYEKRILKGQI